MEHCKHPGRLPRQNSSINISCCWLAHQRNIQLTSNMAPIQQRCCTPTACILASVSQPTGERWTMAYFFERVNIVIKAEHKLNDWLGDARRLSGPKERLQIISTIRPVNKQLDQSTTRFNTTEPAHILLVLVSTKVPYEIRLRYISNTHRLSADMLWTFNENKTRKLHSRFRLVNYFRRNQISQHKKRPFRATSHCFILRDPKRLIRKIILKQQPSYTIFTCTLNACVFASSKNLLGICACKNPRTVLQTREVRQLTLTAAQITVDDKGLCQWGNRFYLQYTTICTFSQCTLHITS